MNSTGKSLWMRIYNGVTTALVALVALAAMALVGVRVVGLTPYAILSGSMEPAYGVGDLIYVRRADPADIRVGDPITFVLNEDLVVATHRVIEIDPLNQLFYTKGDANEVADGAPVHFNNLLGKPVFAIPALGYLSSYIAQPPGTYIAICVGAALLLLLILPDLLSVADRADQKTAQKKAAGTSQDGAVYDFEEYDDMQAYDDEQYGEDPPYDAGEYDETQAYDDEQYGEDLPYDSEGYDDTQSYNPAAYGDDPSYGAGEEDGFAYDGDDEDGFAPYEDSDAYGAAEYDDSDASDPAQTDASWYSKSAETDDFAGGGWDCETGGAYPDEEPDHAAGSKPQAPWYRRLWPK